MFDRTEVCLQCVAHLHNVNQPVQVCIIEHLLLQILETYQVDDTNVLSLVFCRELNVVAAGSASGRIALLPLDRAQQRLRRGSVGDCSANDPRPEVLTGHSAAVSALVMLKDWVLLSASFDCTLRFWDLHTMQELQAGRKVCAHNAPITALAYAAERDEVASVAHENVAKVWDVAAPQRSVMKFQIEATGKITQVCTNPADRLTSHSVARRRAVALVSCVFGPTRCNNCDVCGISRPRCGTASSHVPQLEGWSCL